MTVIGQIENYKPYNEQEESDKELILSYLRTSTDVFSRENKIAHMTASAWVVNKNRTKALMIYHNIYDSWAWLGGHADGEKNLAYVARKEVSEESGLKDIKPLMNDIFSLEVLTVDGHEKNGSYVSSHLHLNITYLFEANEKDELIINPAENSGVKWFYLTEVNNASTEEWFKARIYSKLNTKLMQINL